MTAKIGDKFSVPDSVVIGDYRNKFEVLGGLLMFIGDLRRKYAVEYFEHLRAVIPELEGWDFIVSKDGKEVEIFRRLDDANS